MTSTDLMAVINRVPGFSQEMIEISQNLFQNEGFQSWFLTSEASVLLVNGYHRQHEFSPISTMSTTAVYIMNQLLDVGSRPGRSVAFMHFFCGLHFVDENRLKLMMKAFILQLVPILNEHGCLDIGFINREGYIENLQSGRPTALLDMIRQLCYSLDPHHTVYCFVDGISLFED